MSRLLVCLALTAPALAAQRPWLHPGAAMSLVRYARTDGSDTTSAHGAALGASLAASLGRATLQLSYTEAAFGGGRHAVAGLAAFDVAVHSQAAIGIGLTGFADIPEVGEPLRWWSVEIRGSLDLPMPHTPFVTDVELGFGPAGGVNTARDFERMVRLGAGLSLRLPARPVSLRLAYRLQAATAGTLRDAFEWVTLAAHGAF